MKHDSHPQPFEAKITKKITEISDLKSTERSLGWYIYYNEELSKSKTRNFHEKTEKRNKINTGDNLKKYRSFRHISRIF